MKVRKPIQIDAILLTIMVFLFMFLVSVLFPIKLKVFHPIKDAFSDFDYTDFYFSKLKKEPDVSNDIIIVNIGHLSRAEIAAQLEVIKSGNPKTIGLDAIFYTEKDQFGDSLLESAIQSCDNLVGISKINGNDLELSHPKFQPKTIGFANLYGDDRPEKVIRYFSVNESVANISVESFAAALARKYDAGFDKRIEPHLKEKLKINYRTSSSFITISPFDLFDPNFKVDQFNDKVVLMGYTGIADDSTDMEDQHFTPMNVKMAGKSLPDMKGIYIHASILQSLIENNFIRNSASWIELILTILITFFIAWLVLFFYVHVARWFHLMAKLVQLLAGIVFLFVSIWIMHKYHIKINFTILFVALVLCADLVYFYDPFAKWLHKKNWFHSEILKH